MEVTINTQQIWLVNNSMKWEQYDRCLDDTKFYDSVLNECWHKKYKYLISPIQILTRLGENVEQAFKCVLKLLSLMGSLWRLTSQ